MRKNIFTIYLLAVSPVIYAQQNNVRIGIGADLCIPRSGYLIHDSKTGFGGYIKGLKGISNPSQITLTVGYATFPAKESGGRPDKITISIFSILPGYRYSFKGFYVEPQAGYSANHSKAEPANGFIGPATRYTSSQFMWAVGVGYEIHNVDLGIRYQSQERGPVTLWGIHLGYNFSLKKK